MEERKEKETAHYNTKVFSDELDYFLLQSYRFLISLVKDKCSGKVVLDYGCGAGAHSLWLAKYAREVIGIDLSKKSLEIATKRTKKGKFLLMDCEDMKFGNKSFDIVFDGGTFSSLDLDNVLPELARVLKPGGFVMGIETLGHNPFINLKRRLNKVRGKRTKWAVEHIFRIEDLKRVKKYFGKTEVYFFHLVSWLAFPFLKFSFGRSLLRFLEKLDKALIKFFPFLKKYSFKIVFIFSKPYGA